MSEFPTGENVAAEDIESVLGGMNFLQSSHPSIDDYGGLNDSSIHIWHKKIGQNVLSLTWIKKIVIDSEPIALLAERQQFFLQEQQATSVAYELATREHTLKVSHLHTVEPQAFQLPPNVITARLRNSFDKQMYERAFHMGSEQDWMNFLILIEQSRQNAAGPKKLKLRERLAEKVADLLELDTIRF